MGAILERMKELEPAARRLKQLKEECRMDLWSTAKLVEDLFSTLKPFCMRKVCVNVVDDGDPITYEIGRKYIRERGSWEHALHTVKFVNAIRKHGEKIAAVVRKAIAKEFKELAELTKELIWAEGGYFVVVRDDTFEVLRSYNVPCELATYSHACITSGSPWKITFYNQKPEESNSTEMSINSVFVLDHYYDLVEDMLLELRKKVAEAKEKNEEVLKKMREAVAPYAIAAACDS